MGIEDDVLKMKKRIDKMVSNESINTENALDMMKRLKEMPLTLEILQVTKIGLSVNLLRKNSSDDNILAPAKALMKSWKRLLPAQNSKEKKKSTDEEETNSGYNDEKPVSSDDNNSNQNSARSTPELKPPEEQLSFLTELPDALNTSDPVRMKCRDLLTQALKTDPESLGSDFEPPDHGILAAQIEDCIYCEFGNTEMKYKTRVRSRVANLKDIKNPGLRQKVLMGEIPHEKIAKMSAEEMASNEMKQLRQKMTQEAINDHQMAVNQGAKTDLIKCKRCRKNDCSYTQLQTRSSDEPMTTFCLCNQCGFRWKFC